ncbi:hypothetical protein PybrP1_007275 [[Pythium] brassicae (nom. inval.)]|nr:hypothetical protein PybrP1_007275 [[Pythium] brassicae (nom. inval.)]
MLNHHPLHAAAADAALPAHHHHHHHQYVTTSNSNHNYDYHHHHAGDNTAADAYSGANYYSLPYAQQAYYAPAAAPLARQHQQQQQQPPPPQYALSAMSLKRKMPGAPTGLAMAPMPSSAQEKLCELCYHPDPVLFSPGCGHLFHSRCVHVWPLAACPVCDAAMPSVGVLRIDMNAQIDPRSGKWTRPEEKFIDGILAEFDRSAFPLANGTPVRLVLAKLLNCSTMRLSKKFQKNALGKRTFRVAKPGKGEPAMAFARADHVARQTELSRLEAVFRHELVEQFRRENNTDEGAHVEALDLRHAVQQFWVVNFVKLAVLIGQPVRGLDVADAKKRKLALVMIRNGQFDELLAWNRSPANTPTISPLPLLSSGDHAPWNPAVYGSGPQPVDPQHQQHQQPVKKMRTPESMPRTLSGSSADLDPPQFEVQPAPPMAVATAYEYGKASPPRGYSPAAAADHHYYAGYARSDGYAPYAAVKSEKVESLQHQQQQQHFAPHFSGYGGSGGAYRGIVTHSQPGGSYQSVSDASDGSHQQQHQPQQHQPQYPWDELLEGIAEPNAQVVDPSLQAWSNLHIM